MSKTTKQITRRNLDFPLNDEAIVITNANENDWKQYISFAEKNGWIIDLNKQWIEEPLEGVRYEFTNQLKKMQ